MVLCCVSRYYSSREEARVVVVQGGDIGSSPGRRAAAVRSVDTTGGGGTFLPPPWRKKTVCLGAVCLGGHSLYIVGRKISFRRMGVPEIREEDFVKECAGGPRNGGGRRLLSTGELCGGGGGRRLLRSAEEGVREELPQDYGRGREQFVLEDILCTFLEQGMHLLRRVGVPRQNFARRIYGSELESTFVAGNTRGGMRLLRSAEESVMEEGCC